jgi:hypothetical protein
MNALLVKKSIMVIESRERRYSYSEWRSLSFSLSVYIRTEFKNKSPWRSNSNETENAIIMFTILLKVWESNDDFVESPSIDSVSDFEK